MNATATLNGKPHAAPPVALEGRARSLVEAARDHAAAERRRWDRVRELVADVLAVSTAESLAAAEEVEQLLLAHRRNEGLIYSGVRAAIEAATEAIESDAALPPVEEPPTEPDSYLERELPGFARPAPRTFPAAPPSAAEITATLDAYKNHAEDGQRARDENRPAPRRPDSPPSPQPAPAYLPEDDPEGPPFEADPPSDPGPAQVPPPAENSAPKPPSKKSRRPRG